VLMVLGGSVAWRWGIAAERKPLEAVARPLTFMISIEGTGAQAQRIR
jgi:hypothetical protein